MSTKEKNIIGLKFGMLTVLERVENIGKSIRYNCKCDCGKTKIIYKGNLIKEQGTKSCSCLKYKTTNGVKPKLTSTYILYKQYAQNAKTRKDVKAVFSLTIEEFKDLITQNCFYCDSLPYKISPKSKNEESFFYHGIDRLDNNLGYTKENSKPCCYFCNSMKSNYTQEFFINHIKKIYLNQ